MITTDKPILADSSVWIDYLRHPEPSFTFLLRRDLIRCHPFVLGEVALGHVKSRDKVIAMLKSIMPVRAAADDEVLAMIQRDRLFGRGVGYVDCHLLAAARLDRSLLWSRDRRLMAIAEELGIAFPETTH